MPFSAWSMVVVCGFLQLHSALGINCTVSDDDHTTYNISGVSQVSDVNASKCEYSWTGDSVLAHHKWENPVLVLRNSIDTLVTLECFDKIFFTRNCVSEGTEYKAICTVNCTLNALRRSQKDKEISRSWIPAIVAFVILLLLLLLLLVFLCYKCRDKTPRRCSCSQLGCIYTAVKTQNVGP